MYPPLDGESPLNIPPGVPWNGLPGTCSAPSRGSAPVKSSGVRSVRGTRKTAARGGSFGACCPALLLCACPLCTAQPLIPRGRARDLSFWPCLSGSRRTWNSLCASRRRACRHCGTVWVSRGGHPGCPIMSNLRFAPFSSKAQPTQIWSRRRRRHFCVSRRAGCEGGLRRLCFPSIFHRFWRG